MTILLQGQMLPLATDVCAHLNANNPLSLSQSSDSQYFGYFAAFRFSTSRY
ncbi:hypothetical protein [Photobacterium sanctipauli]|uniref:hypothetical protein n=1 Tax=Photobacterium sanctipauli TaxID=1342794 RepID=UPI000A66D4A1|nr:hypothetical protein [Photobacterium sanctipauli]